MKGLFISPVLLILLFAVFFFLLFSTASHADTANCKIEIQDVLKGTIYTVEQKFNFEYGATMGQRKHFDVPGNDYSCTLAFFELHKGTMLSCEYTKDLGHTFFQSDHAGGCAKAEPRDSGDGRVGPG